MRSASTTVHGELSYLDSSFLFAESDLTPQAIVNAYLLDAVAPGASVPRTGPLFVEWIASRIHSSPVFTNVLVRSPFDLAPPRWVHDESFDATNHVFVHDHSGPAAASLNVALADISGRRLDLTRPPWEVHLLLDVQDEGAACDVVVVKVHHCAADGIASADLGRILLSEDPLVDAGHELPGAARRSTSLVSALPTLPRQLLRHLRSVRRLSVLQRELAEEVAAGHVVLPLQERPRTRFNASIGPNRTVGSVRLSLTAARAVRSDTTQATVNDVALATVSGALVEYLQPESDEQPRALAVHVPKSVRGQYELKAANQVVPMIVDLHTSEDNPRKRLSAITASVAAERNRREHPLLMESVSCADSIPAFIGRFGAWKERRRARPVGPVERCNSTVSNYMRESGRLALGSAPVVEIRCVPIIDHGTGLAHMVASAGDALTITFTVDRAMMPDPDRYCAMLRDAFAALTR